MGARAAAGRHAAARALAVLRLVVVPAAVNGPAVLLGLAHIVKPTEGPRQTLTNLSTLAQSFKVAPRQSVSHLERWLLVASRERYMRKSRFVTQAGICYPVQYTVPCLRGSG